MKRKVEINSCKFDKKSNKKKSKYHDIAANARASSLQHIIHSAKYFVHHQLRLIESIIQLI
jgi:hypothetical protein